MAQVQCIPTELQDDTRIEGNQGKQEQVAGRSIHRLKQTKGSLEFLRWSSAFCDERHTAPPLPLPLLPYEVKEDNYDYADGSGKGKPDPCVSLRKVRRARTVGFTTTCPRCVPQNKHELLETLRQTG
mmetsp:Transcript_67221/g.132588  ORF Transcript_67221/g.132588 Transcript_67221/m.132588 type:complete len:127 (-) Transcript_67221:905-1285(-)